MFTLLCFIVWAVSAAILWKVIGPFLAIIWLSIFGTDKISMVLFGWVMIIGTILIAFPSYQLSTAIYITLVY